MLTVLIEVGAEPGPLALSLAALVPGAVEGLVREVIVIDRGADPATREVADQAGCRIEKSDPLAKTIQSAKGEWLLFLEPGARPLDGWIDEVSAYLQLALGGLKAPGPACLSVQRSERPSLLSRLMGRRTALHRGLLLSKPVAMRAATGRATLEALAAGLKPRRIAAELSPRPPRRPR